MLELIAKIEWKTSKFLSYLDIVLVKDKIIENKQRQHGGKVTKGDYFAAIERD